MPSHPKNPPLFGLILLPILAIIAGAFVLSGAATFESIRFYGTIRQILGIVSETKAYAKERLNITLQPGENLWDTLTRAGEISASIPRQNRWNNDMNVVASSDSTFRIDMALPSPSCRRMALYFLKQRPTELGLLAIEAKAATSPSWLLAYSNQRVLRASDAEAACGFEKESQIAFFFKIR